MASEMRALSLDVPAAIAEGAALDTDRLAEKAVYLAGTFSATIEYQVSADGTNWFTIGPAVSAPSVTTIPMPAMFLRAKVTAYTSGTPTALVVAPTVPQAG